MGFLQCTVTLMLISGSLAESTPWHSYTTEQEDMIECVLIQEVPDFDTTTDCNISTQEPTPTSKNTIWTSSTLTTTDTFTTNATDSIITTTATTVFPTLDTHTTLEESNTNATSTTDETATVSSPSAISNTTLETDTKQTTADTNTTSRETTKSPSSGGVNITDFTTGPTTTVSSSSTDSTTREDNTHTTSSIPADKTTEATTRDKTTAIGNNVTTAGATTTDKPATTTEDSSSSTDSTTREDNTHTTSSIPADKTTEATTRDKTTANGDNVTTAGATTTDKPATTTEGATTTESSLITGITTSEDNTRTNSSAPAVTSEGLCVGEECLCPVNLYGQKCQFIQNEIKTEKVIIKLGVSVRVTNHEFDLELSNNLSEAYRSFEKSFNQQMEDLYRNISNYKGMRISSIKNGSVIVEHNILVEVNFVTRTQEYEDACAFIRATLSATTCTENNGMCFSAKDTDVCRQGINVPGLCSEVGSIPKEMQQYFYGLERGKALLCVTPCSTLSPQPVQCIMGQCLVSESGPSCYCDTSGQFWYTGDRCQTVINKAGVYGGVAVGLAVLLIVIVALSILLHKQHKSILLYKRRSSGSYNFGWEKHRKQRAQGNNPDFMDSMWGPAGTFQANKGTSHVRLKTLVARN